MLNIPVMWQTMWRRAAYNVTLAKITTHLLRQRWAESLSSLLIFTSSNIHGTGREYGFVSNVLMDSHKL